MANNYFDCVVGETHGITATGSGLGGRLASWNALANRSTDYTTYVARAAHAARGGAAAAAEDYYDAYANQLKSRFPDITQYDIDRCYNLKSLPDRYVVRSTPATVCFDPPTPNKQWLDNTISAVCTAGRQLLNGLLQ